MGLYILVSHLSRRSSLILTMPQAYTQQIPKNRAWTRPSHRMLRFSNLIKLSPSNPIFHGSEKSRHRSTRVGNLRNNTLTSVCEKKGGVKTGNEKKEKKKGEKNKKGPESGTTGNIRTLLPKELREGQHGYARWCGRKRQDGFYYPQRRRIPSPRLSGYLEETAELDSWRDPRGVKSKKSNGSIVRVKRRKRWPANNRSIFPPRKNLGPMSRSPLSNRFLYYFIPWRIVELPKTYIERPFEHRDFYTHDCNDIVKEMRNVG